MNTSQQVRRVAMTIWRCVWNWPKLAANAASMTHLRAGDRVLFGDPGAARTLPGLGCSASPVAAPRSLSRPVAQERRRLHAIRPSSARRSGSVGPHACDCGPGSRRAAVPVSAHGPRLDLPSAPDALQRPHWGGALRVSPSACRCYPMSCKSGSKPFPPQFSEGSELPSAVSGTCPFVCKPGRTASVGCCAPGSRPSPTGGRTASLDRAP